MFFSCSNTLTFRNIHTRALLQKLPSVRIIGFSVFLVCRRSTRTCVLILATTLAECLQVAGNTNFQTSNLPVVSVRSHRLYKILLAASILLLTQNALFSLALNKFTQFKRDLSFTRTLRECKYAITKHPFYPILPFTTVCVALIFINNNDKNNTAKTTNAGTLTCSSG